jgi:hypothetical protein
MQSLSTPPSSFESLINELFGRDERPAGAPRPHPLSINSLEAAWSLAANSRAMPDEPHVPPAHRYPFEGESIDDPKGLLDPNKILLELGLDLNFSEADIATLRREFALRNHPDRVLPELQELATQRMMIANDLMDRYVARLRKNAD